MTEILEQVYLQTGWIGVALFAGPDPAQARNINVVQYVRESSALPLDSMPSPAFARFHKGRNAQGHLFSAAYGQYTKRIVKPFTEFASAVFRE